MRIAQVAPLYESTPPKLYGGTERVVSYLTEELIRRGHDVTLFAGGDSVTSAELVAPCERALPLNPHCRDPLACHMVMLEEVFRRAEDFDVVRFHVDYLHFPVSSRPRIAHLTTLHGRLDLPELPQIYRQFPDVPLISISDAQRRPLPWENWRATIAHGLPANLYSVERNPETYLAFIGRISPEKRVDLAMVDYISEIGEPEKQEFLSGAHALLFPIDWLEPFGLVMIEAMACGTPVIAYRNGSVPEIIEEGTTGFVVSSIDRRSNGRNCVDQDVQLQVPEFVTVRAESP